MSFFVFDKLINISSFNFIKLVKKKLIEKGIEVKKIGHTGTLDPLASGVLIIAINEDTKLLDKFLLQNKMYQGVIELGRTTETLDIDGTNISTHENFVFNDQQKLDNIIKKKFNGKILQIPPIYSSIKVNGNKAYDLARQGKAINLQAREREIFNFTTKFQKPNFIEFEILVSSGTYIRSIAKDLAKELNTIGMIIELKRTKIGDVLLEIANKIDDENYISYSRNQILKIQEIIIGEEILKKFLEGKLVELKDINFQEIFIKNATDNIVVLITKKSNNNYQLFKRIK